ncbi:MAG: CBS domain-containing protein [Nanoarchaeota archaeon]|nr:CBS domain-containing protein [Nanoarchaeota archaeon]
MKVSEVMNKAVVIDSDMTLKQAAKIMSQNGIGCLTFLKNEKIRGIITERDILKNVSHLNMKVSSVMTKSVVVVDINEDLEKVISIMARHKIKKILIVEKGSLIGIVTSTDIISHSDLLHEDMFF